MIARPAPWRATGSPCTDGAETPAQAARAIAAAAEQLRPDWQQPERFFEAKSELVDAARALAATLERN